MPPAEQARRPGARRPGGIQVFENGAPRRVTRVEELALAGEDGAALWQVAIYWDAELAGPVLGRAAARLLARQAERITRLGEATLVAAVEAPRVIVAGTRDPARLATALDAHFVLERRKAYEWPLELTPGDVANAVAMGPSARHATRAETGTAATPVTASVTISTYRARSG